MSLSDRSQKKFYVFCPLPDCIWLLLCTCYTVSVSSQLIWYSCLFLVMSPGLGPTWARIGPSLRPMFFWRPRVDFLRRAQVQGIPDFFKNSTFYVSFFPFCCRVAMAWDGRRKFIGQKKKVVRTIRKCKFFVQVRKKMKRSGF